MRSYYAHLETALGEAKKPIPSKPVFRSSAIFPVFQSEKIHSRILFMGYWILKRNIQQIAAVVSLRAEKGELLARKNILITEPKSFRVELSDMLDIPQDVEFIGSLEIEFFSTSNLVFPFPAVAINYYGPNFSTVVHTAQRVYNDFDDLKNNSQTKVPESGFNIYAEEGVEPFIGMINGPEAIEEAFVTLQIFNARNEELFIPIEQGRIEPYETKIIHPGQLIDLQSFLEGGVGTIKVNFHRNWIFPRLVVGNINHSLQSLSITHTYYDCNKADLDSDYWLPNKPEWHSAALMIPGHLKNNHFTNVYFYPIYSPASFDIDVEIYDEKGVKLGTQQHALQIEPGTTTFRKIALREICQKLGIDINNNVGIRLIADPQKNGRIPSRIKVGIDVGTLRNEKMACNICANLQPFNPVLETKPSTFKWQPLLADQPQATIWVMNSSPAMKHLKTAEVTATFYREQDTNTIKRTYNIPPFGFKVIDITQDEELKDFFQNTVGWCTTVSTNPYTTTYYFAENPSGVVGGDHGF